MKKVFLVRHGQTEWNLQRRTQGVQDSKLTEKGMSDTSFLADKLSHEDIEVIYSSSLNRAKETATIIANKLKVPVLYDKGLIELNYGHWEGLTIDEIRKRYPEELEKWFAKPHTAVFPKGEQLHKAQERIVSTYLNILNSNQNKNILIVSHSTMIKLLLLHLLGMSTSSFNRLKQGNCAINVIGIRNEEHILLKYNDTCHIHKGD